jgi:hypothetical protein
VIAAVDGKTGTSTALTPDLTPVLAAYPPINTGVSALDGAGATLWLLGAGGANSPSRGAVAPTSPTDPPVPVSGCTEDACPFSYYNEGAGRCGEVDAASRMPADIWNDQKAVNDYVAATIKWYNVGGAKLKQALCYRPGRYQQGSQSVSWTSPDLMKYTCNTLCSCNYPSCPDAPDAPKNHRYCSLCGPKFNQPIEVKFWAAKPVLIGVPLSKGRGLYASAQPPSVAGATNVSSTPMPLTIIDAPADDMVVCGFAFASSINAVVAIEYNGTGNANAWFGMPNARIRAYPVDKSPPITIGTVDAGKVNPSVGSATVSADGKYVYFGAVQGSAAFESAALITVDVVGKLIELTLAAPSDDYDVLNTVLRC